MLPGCTDSASAVKAWLEFAAKGRHRDLQRMCREWPFFQMLLSNMDMLLAKSDIAIASRYGRACLRRRAARPCVWPVARGMAGYTIDALQTIMGQETLLESNPLLARSIRHRFPYLDPLNHMQIEL